MFRFKLVTLDWTLLDEVIEKLFLFLCQLHDLRLIVVEIIGL